MVGMVGCTFISFWIWKNNHRYQARDVGKACISGNLPRFRKPPYINKLSDLTLIEKKTRKVRERRYIFRGQVRSLTQFLVFLKAK